MQISKRGECRDLDKNGVFHHETVLYKHLHKFTFLPDRLVATSLGEMHSTGYQPAELHQVAKPNQHIKLQNLHKQGGWERKQCSPPKNNSLHDTHDVESVHATKAAMSIKSKCSMHAQPQYPTQLTRFTLNTIDPLNSQQMQEYVNLCPATRNRFLYYTFVTIT